DQGPVAHHDNPVGNAARDNRSGGIRTQRHQYVPIGNRILLRERLRLEPVEAVPPDRFSVSDVPGLKGSHGALAELWRGRPPRQVSAAHPAEAAQGAPTRW